ncbi:MAG: Trk system potassium transporter TrkA [Deltaproteobacteria bacterium]|nr:MAG: Trk system potassium transporter TrkA [Deltaproteobacteria bacterium]
MYVVVVGIGQVGRHIVRTLAWQRHDVVVIDEDRQVIQEIEEHHDVMSLVGYGANENILREAGVAKADLVVAVTDNDEINLITALAAKQLGAKKVVARVQGAAWSDRREGVSYGLLGVDVVVNPRLLLSQEMAKVARSHGALEVIDLANDRVELVQMELGTDCRLLKKPLSRLELPKDTLVAAIVRDGELSVPGGADVLRANDRIYLLGRRENIERAEDLFTGTREARSAAVIGGGVIGTTLARQLCHDGTRVMLFERDAERARSVAEELPKVTVIQGDGTNLVSLREENVGAYDLFVATTDDDETNLMSCLLAKRAGAKRTISVVHRPDYLEIYKQLGIDIVLSPRIAASDHILRYTRATEIKSLTELEGGQAHVLEIVATAGSRALGVPLRRLGIPRGALIAAIVNDKELTIPRGDNIIEEGDTVIVLATERARPAIQRLFQRRVL